MGLEVKGTLAVTESTKTIEKLFRLGFATSIILIIVGGGMFFNEYYIDHLTESNDIGTALTIFKTSMDLKSAGFITAIFGLVVYLVTLSAMLIDRLS